MNTPTPHTDYAKMEARAERAEAEVERLKTCGITELAAINPSVLDYCKHWEARAERAEADLAAEREKSERYRLTTLKLDAELADQAARFHDEIVRRQGTVRANQELDLKELNHFRDLFDAERARLDWLESDAGMDWQWNDTMYGIVSRAAIDEAMKEGAK